MKPDPTAPAEPAPTAPRRRRFTPFGACVFVLSIVLLIGKLAGWVGGAETLDRQLADGLRHVDAFAFAGNYLREVREAVASADPGSAGAGTLLGAVLFSVPAAIGDSLSGGGWALLGLLMSLGLGTLVMWDSIRQSIFWVAAVPFVGGLIAWVLSFVVLQFVLLTLLVVLQGLGLVSGMASLAPRFTDMVGSLMDQFHLSKSVASDASTVFGRGKLAESLERLEKR